MKCKTPLVLLTVVMAVAPPMFAQEKFGAEFAAFKAQYDARVKSDVQQVYDVGVADLNVKYLASLDRALDSAMKGGKLEDAVALKQEKETIKTEGKVPDKNDEKTSASLAQLRDVYRASMKRLETDRAKRLQPLNDNFARSLDGVVTHLLKDGKITEAAALKNYRDELSSQGAASAGGSAKNRIASGEDLVRKPWKRKWDKGTAEWIFSRDKTVLASGGYKGTWSIRGKVMRADFGTSWADYSLEIERSGNDIVLKEIDSNKGKHPDITLTQSGQ